MSGKTAQKAYGMFARRRMTSRMHERWYARTAKATFGTNRYMPWKIAEGMIKIDLFPYPDNFLEGSSWGSVGGQSTMLRSLSLSCQVACICC